MIQKRVTEVSGNETHTAAAQEDHLVQCRQVRVLWCQIQLELRARSYFWRKVVWCDVIHWSTGPNYVRKVKRRPGKLERDRASNTQGREDNHPDPELQQKFHIFCVVGYNFVFAIPYDAGNSNSKMNSDTFLQLLPQLHREILGLERILYADRDSTHISKSTLNWMDLHGMEYLIGPPKSPDLSIMETWVKVLREKFYQRRCASTHAGVQRFYKVWADLNPEKINETIDSYPARLHEVIRVEGRATRY